MTVRGDNTTLSVTQETARVDHERSSGGTVIMLLGQLAFGGGERHMLTLANSLSQRFDIVLAYLRPGEAMLDQIHRELMLDSRCLQVSKRIDTRAARELASLADRHSAQMIVCANANTLMYAHLAHALSARTFDIVEIFHTTKPRTLKERLSLLLYRPLFWVTHHLVFVCQAQRRYWRRRGLWARHTSMIYNGVDTSYFEPSAFDSKAAAMRQTLGFGVDDHVVGICAVLRPEKAHADLLSAVAALRREGCIWRVLMIGDGPRRAAIEAEVARLGLTGSVRITGFQSDVREAMAACDVLALVSTSETFSIASLEAMAMGRPMIMSDVGGAREQVDHGVNGLLFPAGNVLELARCLRESTDKSRLRKLGLAARRRVELEFSLQSMLDAYASLFGKILARRLVTGRKSIEQRSLS